MGIPYYFYSLTQKYANILVDKLPFKPDIYCIDFNGIIHTTAQDIMKHHDTNFDDKIIQSVWDKIEQYIKDMEPSKLIICADGVAPMAKIIQQRKRRYLSIYKNKLDNIKSKWDTNAITPGTEFMNSLNKFIKTKIRYNSTDTNIIYSGSDENGEGEHKIFDKLVIESDDAKIIVNGLDADLIILSLLSHKKNIYLMRETLRDKAVCNYLNIHELRTGIVKELCILWKLQNIDDIYSNESNDLIESYCVACTILGNDFIPHLLTLDLKSNGLDTLIEACREAIKEHGLIVKEAKIDHCCLSAVFVQLMKKEDASIFAECEKNIKKIIHGKPELESDLYALKNKSKLALTIYNNPSKWRHEYYKELFESNITLCSSVVFQACENYIKGIYWTYSYYKKKDLDYYWYYPYSYPPTIKDIANHSIANSQPEITLNGDFIPSYLQLLLVLPRDSKTLMKKQYHTYVDNVHAGLYHLYPINYKIQTFLKTHLWECSPILPMININYIKRVLSL